MRIDQAIEPMEKAYAILQETCPSAISPHGWGSTYLKVCRMLGHEPSWQPEPEDLLAAAQRLARRMEAA